MELSELPECPVCLQPYDGEYTIPRVLTCGHTACESCLSNLPQKFPQAIRCPACTVVVKLPPQGPSLLPKNIDLLRLITASPLQNPPKPVDKRSNDLHVSFLPRLWSSDFYSIWKDYVLPEHTVETEKVSAFSVGSLLCGGDSVLKVALVVRVMDCLSGMGEEEREELSLVLRFYKKQNDRICRVLGLCGDFEDGFLYLVSERGKNSSSLDKLGDFKEADLFSFALIAMEVCETVSVLHKEGLIAGCIGFSCFQSDEFGHFHLDLTEVLKMGRTVRKVVLDMVSSSKKRISDEDIEALLTELSKRDVFVSPEVLFEVLRKEGYDTECSGLRYSVGYGSDVWLIGCILFRLLIGEQFGVQFVDYLHHVILKASEDNGLDCSGICMSLLEKESTLLSTKFGSEFATLPLILSKSLDIDPQKRPLATDIWKCIRELVSKSQFDTMVALDGTRCEKNGGQCLVVGELCRLPKERMETLEKDDQQGAESNGLGDCDHDDDAHGQSKLVDGLAEGNIKSKDLQGHLDCVTGLAVGGGFLLSSSFDKSVKVWSLQDYSHVHTFKGHEHKITAIVCVDEEKPFCITSDSGGGIFFWSITVPLGQEPSKKWYEQKDWRFSGIHAMAVSENGYLYTGSGDKSIKVWSLQDGTLSCTMTGHKSVVSTLTLSDGILYSGGWDGTIRLWSLGDHSLLTVLGENTPGSMTPVLALGADQHILVAAHENGSIKVWRDDIFWKSIQIHNNSIFAIDMDGQWLFTGSWDKTVNVQELVGDDFEMDARHVGSIPCHSTITSLLFWEGKLFVGFADRMIKVYYYGK
ncbi:hypothetical protein SLEP1_g2101 [Rubroshorea leprosula]|uniref:Uncharacterized protein n=1 Tax=Rubroshorea leprosula TaxID=152421 RepID=A0AAV5HQJ6_9ROSI|nr:hypothetical protein SLEP1_g2101 [Rubroshorea leprosula]